MTYTKKDMVEEVDTLIRAEVTGYLMRLAEMVRNGEVSSTNAKVIFKAYTKEPMFQAFKNKRFKDKLLTELEGNNNG